MEKADCHKSSSLQPHEAPQAYEWPEEPRVAATYLSGFRRSLMLMLTNMDSNRAPISSSKQQPDRKILKLHSVLSMICHHRHALSSEW
jgi:hypothetical protein